MTNSTTNANRHSTEAIILVHSAGGRKYSGVTVLDKSGRDEVVSKSASGMPEDGEGEMGVTSSTGGLDGVETASVFVKVDCTSEEVTSL